MKVLKEESKTAQKIRDLEQYLTDNNIMISQRPEGLGIIIDSNEYIIKDDSGEVGQELPVFVGPTRIVLLE